MTQQCIVQHQVAKYNMSTKQQGLNMYPSWYARYLLAFNNQLKCRERVQDLRHSLISEEQRYLDQASNRVRDFVLAGKHTVRPLVGDNLPRNQPAKSHPVMTRSLPKRLPLLRPQQGYAIPEDERRHHHDVTHHKRRRRKRKTPSPQYPTFCFEELVVRAEAEKRRETRRKKEPVDIATESTKNILTRDSDKISIPPTMLFNHQPSNKHETKPSNTRLRGTPVAKAYRTDHRHSPNTSESLPTNLPPLQGSKQVAMVTSATSKTVKMPQVNISNSASDSHFPRPSPDQPPIIVSDSAHSIDTVKDHNSITIRRSQPSQVSPSQRYIPPMTSPESISEDPNTGDVMMRSSNSNINEFDSGFVIEYNDLLLPKESILLENGDSSIGQTPVEETSQTPILADDRKRLKRRDYHRKHLRQMKRNSIISLNNDYSTNETELHLHGNSNQSTQDNEFPEIEAVRRWQLSGEECETKMDDVMERPSLEKDNY